MELQQRDMAVQVVKEGGSPGAPEPVRESDQATESSAALLREAIDEARELVRLEAELARQELKEEIVRTKAAGMAFGAAAVTGIAGFTMLVATIAFAAGRSWLCALLLGAALLLVAGLFVLVGYRSVPTFAVTRERVEASLRGLRERIA
jgi:hypothetical protein